LPVYIQYRIGCGYYRKFHGCVQSEFPSCKDRNHGVLRL
jgi:hypothetical protein